MRIFILRHAVAEVRRPNLPDSKRALTPEGLKELQVVVRGLKKLKVRPAVVLSSPYRRAWDTAVVAQRALSPGKRPVECDALKPGGSPTRIWMGLREYATLDSVMLVGHEPLLSETAAYLLHSPHLNINFKKSGLIRVDVETVKTERPAGELRWLLTPRQLARLG